MIRHGLVSRYLSVSSCFLQLESVQLPPTWPYALHLLAHLYHGNLEDARLLWMQIPDSAKQVGWLGAPCTLT